MLQLNACECMFDGVAAFGKVRPVLEMNRDNLGGRECTSGFCSFCRRHREVIGTNFGDTGSTEVKDGNLNLESARNFLDTGIPDSVPGNVNDALRRVRKGEGESDHRSAAEAFRTMAGRSRDDAQRPAVCRGKIGALPIFETDTVSAEALSPFGRSKYGRGVCQERSARMIEIIGVMIMTEKNVIKAAQGCAGDRGALELAKRHWACSVRASGRIEGRIG